MKILITGIAGTGKSTVISELNRLGHIAVDLDTADVCSWIDKETGAETTYEEGAGASWIEGHRWQVVVPKLIALLNSFPDDENIYIGGKVSRHQIEDLNKIFDKVFLLSPSDQVVEDRLSTRKSNAKNFAKTREERDFIIRYRDKFEQVCVGTGAIVLENNGDLSNLVSSLLQFIED